MILELKDAAFSYEEGKPLLSHINFAAKSGEVWAILGRNGIGKTTLLRCLLGFEHFKEGGLFIDGAPAKMTGRGRTAFWRRVSYVPQARNQAFPYTVEENVLLGRGAYLGLFSQPGKRDYAAADRAMALAGVADLRDRNCGELSGGQLQLVLIARALAAEPELLIMDEPETGLDFKNQLLVLSLIRKLAEEEKLLVIFNTHYPEHALTTAQKTLLFTGDGTAISGPTEEILTRDNMREAFGVEVIRARAEYGGKTYTSLIPAELSQKPSGGEEKT